MCVEGLVYVGRRRILTGILSAVPETETAVNVPTTPVGTTAHQYTYVDHQAQFNQAWPDHMSQTQARNGNGHKKEKIRDLNESEKNTILDWFKRLNGCIGKDACVSFKRDYFGPVVKIFQVTGYVTSLHGQVRRGKLVLRDMPMYETFLLSHRTLWASYNSAKYVALRNRIGVISNEEEFNRRLKGIT